jgi:hypothetical protein
VGSDCWLLPTNSSIRARIPPPHQGESRIFPPTSKTDPIHIEALGHIVRSKREWVIRTAKFNREIQRIGPVMTMAEVLADSELTGCYDLDVLAAACVA